MRKDRIEMLAHMDKMAGKKARGRQRVRFLRRIAKWRGTSATELIMYTENRIEWYKLIADVI